MLAPFNTWTWTGAVSNDWADAANWDSNSTEPPYSGAYVVIPAGTPICNVTAPTEDVSSVTIYGRLDVFQGDNAELDADTVTISPAVGGGAGTLAISGGLVLATVTNNGNLLLTTVGANNALIGGDVDNEGTTTINGLATAMNFINNSALNFATTESKLYPSTFTQNSAGTTSMVANSGGQCSVINTGGGLAELGGTLNVTAGGFGPLRLDQFTVVQGTICGEFDTVNATMGGYTWAPTYFETQVVLTVADPQLHFIPGAVPYYVGVSSGSPVAQFTDSAAPGLTASNYSVTINWGNGAQAGLVWRSEGNPNYNISGPSWRGDSPGYHTVTVSLTDNVSNVTWTFTLTWWMYPAP